MNHLSNSNQYNNNANEEYDKREEKNKLMNYFLLRQQH